jgi:hypothetical protein
VGRPHVHNFRAHFTGQIKSKPDGAWMSMKAEQYDFFDEPARLFLMQASLYGIPFEALHLYLGPSATMQVKVASLVEVVDARGPKMNQSETVTLFNDMCLLAPASLIDANAEWQERDEHTVLAVFRNAGNTIRAELTFDSNGDLAGFASGDRFQSADGVTYRNLPWSTPVRDYAISAAYGSPRAEKQLGNSPRGTSPTPSSCWRKSSTTSVPSPRAFRSERRRPKSSFEPSELLLGLPSGTSEPPEPDDVDERPNQLTRRRDHRRVTHARSCHLEKRGADRRLFTNRKSGAHDLACTFGNLRGCEAAMDQVAFANHTDDLVAIVDDDHQGK